MELRISLIFERFTAFAAISRTWLNRRCNLDMVTRRVLLRGILRQLDEALENMRLKDIWQLIAVLLKRRVILKRSRLAVMQQCGDGLKTLSPPSSD
jgi:hypothetical protein